MRIRKRQAVVVEPPRPGHLVSTVTSGHQDEQFVGQKNCSCCSRQRRLQNWEFDRESDEPSNRLTGGISPNDENEVSVSKARTVEYGQTETQLSETEKLRGRSGIPPTEDLHNSEITDGEAKESIVAATLESLGRNERDRSNEHNIKAAGARVPLYVNRQFHGSGDVNYPGNKSKESLLYSLYCVFSKLSGKVVLTAREALSRIIEERLPGLDEETGLPSVQVAKMIRSNPYFVHLEGGKFFLCSAPLPGSKEDPDSRDVLGNEDIPRSTSPTNLQGPLKSFSKAESSKKEKQQQPFSNAEVLRTKRARSKEVSTIDNSAVIGAFHKTHGRSRGSKREGQKALKRESSVSKQGKYGDDQPAVPICKRYDGRGWKCNENALPGYSMCRHHHELIVNRLAWLRKSGKLVSKKSAKRRKTTTKPLKEGPVVITEEELLVNNEQNGTHWWKNVKARSLKSINN